MADLSDDRLEIAAALGARVRLGSGEIADLARAVRDRGLDVAIVYEVTGTDPGLRSALHVAERLGARVVLVGLHEQPRQIDLRRITLREIELIGTNAHVCGTDLPEAARLLSERVGGLGRHRPRGVSARPDRGGGHRPDRRTAFHPREDADRPLGRRAPAHRHDLELSLQSVARTRRMVAPRARNRP